SRLLGRGNAGLAALLQMKWYSLDRLVLSCLAVGQLLLAAWGTAPELIRGLDQELRFDGWIVSWPSSYPHVLGAGSVLLFLSSLGSVFTSFWVPERLNSVVGALLLSVTAAFLVASGSPHALTWTLTGAFVVCSLGNWWRHSLGRALVHLRAAPDSTAGAS